MNITLSAIGRYVISGRINEMGRYVHAGIAEGADNLLSNLSSGTFDTTEVTYSFTMTPTNKTFTMTEV